MLVIGDNTLIRQGPAQEMLPSLGLLSTIGEDLGEAGSLIEGTVLALARPTR